MPRKFSIDVPRLKIGRSDRTTQTRLASALDSPPPSPKSIRPALPNTLELELRLACAQLVDASATEESIAAARRARKEQRSLQNSILQSSTVRSALPPSAHHDRQQPQLPRIETAAHDVRLPRQHAASAHPDLYVASQSGAPWHPDMVGRERNIQKTATRVEQIMAGTQHQNVSASLSGPPTKAWTRPDAHSRSKSVSQTMMTATKPRPAYAPRADSVDTTLSASHSDLTDGVSTSTGMTSAVHTPARASKRTSSQNNMHDIDAVLAYETMHGDGMRERLEMHRKKQELHETEIIEQLYGKAATANSVDTVPVAIQVSKMKDRYYSGMDRPSDAPLQVTRSGDRPGTSRSAKYDDRPDTSRSMRCEDRPGTSRSMRLEDRPPTAKSMRSDTRAPSRLLARSRASTNEHEGTEEQRTGRTSIRERATRAARSLSRGVKKHMRSASRPGDSDQQWPTVDQEARSRPQTPNGKRKMSLDFIRRGRQASRDSLVVPREMAMEKHDVPVPAMPSKWDPFPRRGTTGSIHADVTRPGSVDSNMPSAAQRSQAISAAVNLNRKLPPLPSLQSWTLEPGARLLANPSEHSNMQSNGSSQNSSDDRTPTQEHVDQRNHHNATYPGVGPSTSRFDQDRNFAKLPPPLEMSATFFPSDLDFYAPVRTPSPCSESSLKGFSMQKSAQRPALSMDTSVRDEEDDNNTATSSPTSPKVARLISRISHTNLRPQMVDARRPSESPKPPAPPRKDSKRSLDIHQSNTASLDDRSQSSLQPQVQSADPTANNVLHYQLLSRNNAVYSSNEHIQHGDSLQSMIEASSSKPTILSHKKPKKQWWFAGQKKKGDWMSEIENSGSHSGMLVMHGTAASPVIRYC